MYKRLFENISFDDFKNLDLYLKNYLNLQNFERREYNSPSGKIIDYILKKKTNSNYEIYSIEFLEKAEEIKIDFIDQKIINTDSIENSLQRSRTTSATYFKKQTKKLKKSLDNIIKAKKEIDNFFNKK